MATKTSRAEDALARKRMDKEHEQVLNGLREQFSPVFLHSPDGVYLYLDDRHKICNKRLADMFGLTVEEWAAVPSFLEGFVAPEDRELMASNYQEHITTLSRPVTFRWSFTVQVFPSCGQRLTSRPTNSTSRSASGSRNRNSSTGAPEMKKLAATPP